MTSHRIVLLNFDEKDAASVRYNGYNVDQGVMLPYAYGSNLRPFKSPHPFMNTTSFSTIQTVANN